MKIQYRKWFKGIEPRKTKLQVPGWTGEKTRSRGQPHHCKPFIDGATYGYELIYPFDTEMVITTKNGELEFLGDFSKEIPAGQHWDKPFSSFAPHHFGFTSSLDIKTPPGIGTMILPHPKFYTDRTNTVPLAIGGLLRTDFWSRIFFVVFKSPFEGQSCIFRKNEPYAKIIFLPIEEDCELSEMSESECKERMETEKQISSFASSISTKTWKTDKGETFDNKYKVLENKFEQLGYDGMKQYLNSIEENKIAEKKNVEDKARKKMFRKVINHNNH